MKKLVSVSYKIYKKYFQNLKYNAKKSVSLFQIILLWYSIQLDHAR